MRLFLIVTVFFLVSGCSTDSEENYDIYVYTNGISDQIEEDTFRDLVQQLPHTLEEDVRVTFHIPLDEKFFVDVSAELGDLLIMDEHMIEQIMEPEGLAPLDDILPESLDLEGTFYEQILPESGSKHVFAVPLDANMYLLKELGIEPDRPMAAAVPLYSVKTEDSILLLEQLLTY
ncbi:hypothetical protein FLK61_23400 [Paenalkalicoccus suaedae]|uniref:Extracellular solute-binding protein n=1 Tax=Paenalkalicoccus suaedae TaxID=2592382 RepID=A0A859FB33_9BACI|nr:hypothetical protein [Paenalkalicoccus suaedae]QKS69744.1 hypothetical protein FLK61_23400 [Paenalkalicoccus suaedae]